MIAAFAALAAAFVLVPGRRASGLVGEPPIRRDQSGGPLAKPPAALLAAGIVAAAALALLGAVTGSLAAAVLAPAAGFGLRALQRRPAPPRADRSLALALDLCAAALRAGRTSADALADGAPAADATTAAALIRLAGLLRLGADPVRAWAVLDADGPLAPLAATAARSASSGIRLAAAFERLADEVRADCAATATARAHRAGVLAVAPLTACFLPSFVCLGIVPVVVGVAGSALGVLR